MIVNVSGCDGSGKSTLVSMLRTHFPKHTLVVHFSNPKDYADGKKQYYSFLEEHSKNSEFILCDRFYEGEWVYAPIYRGYTADYRKDIEEQIITVHNYLLVLLHANLEDILARTDARGEDFVKREHFQLVLDNFLNNFLLKQSLPYIYLNTSVYSPEECFKLTLKAAQKCFTILEAFRREASRKVTLDDSVIPVMFYPRGNVFAKYMIVGLNPSQRFLNPTVNSTVFHDSYYCNRFNQTLTDAGVYLDLWFTNCFMYPIKGNRVLKKHLSMHQELLDLQIKILQPECIFALGNVAYEYLHSTYPNLRILKRRHPTYVYRFHGRDRECIDNYKRSFQVD